MPAELCRPVNLNAFNCRTRIGRQADGDSWRSVIVIDICGTIQAPADGHEVELRVSIQDVTDNEAASAAGPEPAQTRPAESLLPFPLSVRHGKAVPPDDGPGGLDRGRPDLAGMVRPAAAGRRQIKYSVSVVIPPDGRATRALPTASASTRTPKPATSTSRTTSSGPRRSPSGWPSASARPTASCSIRKSTSSTPG